MQKTVNIVLSLHDGELRIDCENADDETEIMRLPSNVMVTLQVCGPVAPDKEEKLRAWIDRKSPDHRDYDGWLDTENKGRFSDGPAVYRWYGKQDCCF